VYRRGKSLVGAFHSSDIPEFYGFSASPDFIGTDALGMFPNLFLLSMWFDLPWLPVNFANTGNPAIPHNSKSLLSNVDWKPWGSSAQHPLLTFLDPAPNVSITFDTFRVDAMNLLNNITLGLASASAP
jgi:acetylcholinesterase